MAKTVAQLNGTLFSKLTIVLYKYIIEAVSRILRQSLLSLHIKPVFASNIFNISYEVKKLTVAQIDQSISVLFYRKSLMNYCKTMFVIILVLAANNAVFASQRDPMKLKSSYSKGGNLNDMSTSNLVENISPNEENTLKKSIFIRKGHVNEVNSSVFSLDEHNLIDSKIKKIDTISERSTESNFLKTSVSSILTEKPFTNITNPFVKSSTQKLNQAIISSTSSILKNSIDTTEENRNGPYFDKSASKNVTALLGKTAYLNCRVKNLGNKTMLLQVSWVRHRDIHLLTVGRYTYTSDQRFRAIHQPQTEDWILQIKYPQHRDSGIYECQVSTTPHMSHYIHLNVVEASTEIVGAPDLYIESGSTINLTCVVLNSPEPPAYIFWNHNDAIINYDSPRGGVSVLTIKGETTTSFLLIKSAKPSDSGHYQCNPSNAKPKLVTVHVLNGVSHSVSRGNPSSNAARGTSASSHVPRSLPASLYVNLLVYILICQTYSPTTVESWNFSSPKIVSETQNSNKIHSLHILTTLLSLFLNTNNIIFTSIKYIYIKHLDLRRIYLRPLVNVPFYIRSSRYGLPVFVKTIYQR